MDVKKVFRGISAKLVHDFEISSEIHHNGNKGDYREGALRDFLRFGRLPKRFGVGSGEIIGPERNVSKQCDLVIFDELSGMSFVHEENIQIFPIESVVGVIEVKSKLSKEELLKGLENIKSVKALSPNESVTKRASGPLSVTYRRPKPFGVVFAYALADNSLESLLENLREWESANDRKFWPNLVTVLDEGILYHFGTELSEQNLYSNEEINASVGSSYLAYRTDTLFHFYSILIDLCSGTDCGPVNLGRYFDPAERVGEYVVRNHDRICKGGDAQVYRLNQKFIDKVVSFCKAAGKISHRDLFMKQMGSLPQGFDDDYLNAEVYHYDPRTLPGLHQVSNPFERNENGVFATQEMLLPGTWIEINGETYCYSQCYVTPEDLESVPGKTTKDL